MKALRTVVTLTTRSCICHILHVSPRGCTDKIHNGTTPGAHAMLRTWALAACCSQELRFGAEPDPGQRGGGRHLLQVLVKVKQSNAYKVVSLDLSQ